MVTKKVIDTLYRQFSRPPQSVDELNVGLLFDCAVENHGIFLDENFLYIGSVEPSSPFSMIPLNRINAIVEFDSVIAIVLHSSIVFLDKESDDVNIHVKMEKPSLWERMRMFFLPSPSGEDFPDANIDTDPNRDLASDGR